MIRTAALVLMLTLHFPVYGEAGFGGEDPDILVFKNKSNKPAPAKPAEPVIAPKPPAVQQPPPPAVVIAPPAAVSQPAPPASSNPPPVVTTPPPATSQPPELPSGVAEGRFQPVCRLCQLAKHLKHFVIAPVDGYDAEKIVSRGSDGKLLVTTPECRNDPFLPVRMSHYGSDIRDKNFATGTPNNSTVRAVLPGRIVYSGWNGGYGKFVMIEHELADRTKIYSKYGHLRAEDVGEYKSVWVRNRNGERVKVRKLVRLIKECKLPKNGTYVAAGADLGCVGSTGRSTGPHLHFEIRGGTDKYAPTYDSKHFLLSNGELKYATLCP